MVEEGSRGASKVILFLIFKLLLFSHILYHTGVTSASTRKLAWRDGRKASHRHHL